MINPMWILLVVVIIILCIVVGMSIDSVPKRRKRKIVRTICGIIVGIGIVFMVLVAVCYAGLLRWNR